MSLTKEVDYKPEKGRFGILPINIQYIIEVLSLKYQAEYVIAGVSAMNSLGLSTQLPMIQSYIVSERIEEDLQPINIKIEYNEDFKNFSNNLGIYDASKKKQAYILWSALHYIGKDKFPEYKTKFIPLFNTMLNEHARVKFLKSLPVSMGWVRNELEPKTN